MDLINARDAWKVLQGKMFLRVTALLDSDALDNLFSSDKKITIIPITQENFKFSHVLQDGIKQLIVRSEKVVEIKYNFNETDFDSGVKASITSGGYLKLNNLNFINTTLYFECSKKDLDLEIIELY